MWAKISLNKKQKFRGKNRHQKTHFSLPRETSMWSICFFFNAFLYLENVFLWATAKRFYGLFCYPGQLSTIHSVCVFCFSFVSFSKLKWDEKSGNNTCFMRFSFLAIRPISFRPFGLYHFWVGWVFAWTINVWTVVKLIEKDGDFRVQKLHKTIVAHFLVFSPNTLSSKTTKKRRAQTNIKHSKPCSCCSFYSHWQCDQCDSAK